ncbi:response regulator [methane-oxidizing endosymbiont of Gigantopelta aegis]|uniref:response regulator n=1 Tax=methane-oxidizing endosymbiont of Gigantopelta aegis TaxID=2794938 RepID=UPI0018DCB693|nr:response regulator transcription factor [methane-oxidizing endosymbiont of Gigantopelta aegis]
MRLLLVEDDMILGDGLKTGLEMDGYAVDWVTDGLLAEEALKSNQYELIVLDINLPRKNGLEILRQLRNRRDSTPVLLLTARDTVSDRVLGLDSGADDYVVKPFDLNEIYARLRALYRRHTLTHAKKPLIEHKNVKLDPASHTVFFHNSKIDLSQKEFEILKFLLTHIGQVASRARLEETLYAWDSEVESNTVEVHIHHLRKKLDSKLIRTIRGVGYIIDEE